MLTVILALLVAVILGIAGGTSGLLLPIAFIGLSCFIILLAALFSNPKLVLVALTIYCFLFGILGREVGGFPFGTLIEGLLLLGIIIVVFKIPKQEWKVLNNDLFFLMLGWFILSVMEIANPAGASVQGWLQEIRSAALYPFLITFLAFLLFRTNKDLNLFLSLVFIFSFIAALNGIKQLHFGLSRGEQRFLDEGGATTHVLWGKLRVFSFYSDAGQFGASMAHVGLMAFILALGPFKWWKRMLLLIAAAILLYAMLISGTRGALFALAVGAFLAIILSKKTKVIIIGGITLFTFLFILKFTYIGNGNYQIYRLRSALDPQEASLNVRLADQRVLKNYMATRPFGGGLGVIGTWGHEYNKDKFLSTVEPNSYWVKVWAMYGIVGFVLWFGMMMYILGKCCGIIWKIKNKGLRAKMIALTAGTAGIVFCSYGNEVINTMPSLLIVAISWVFVFRSPQLEDEIERNKEGGWYTQNNFN